MLPKYFKVRFEFDKWNLFNRIVIESSNRSIKIVKTTKGKV